MKAESINRSIKKTALVTLMSAALLMTSVLIPGIGQAHAVTSFKDVSTKHWAYSYIIKAAEKGIVSGYADGTFKPDNPVTRAEFTSMLNSALGNTGTTDIGFPDVSKSSWYYNVVSKGVAAGFISGTADGTFKPDSAISRQEAAVMLARIVPTYGYSWSVTNFYDASSVPGWSKESIERIVAKGYLGTYGDNMIHVTDALTRAQAARMVVAMVENEKIITNSQTAVKTGVNLKEMIFANKISVGTAVEDGNITFENCMVLGTLNVEGGGLGPNGVIVNNTRVANCVVQRYDAAVRVLASGETSILNTEVRQIGRLETSGLKTGNGFGLGFQNVNLKRAADAELLCNLALLEVEGSKCDVSLERGTVSQLIVYSGAYKTDIKMASGTAVTTADVYAAGTAFAGAGKITILNAHADNITYETEPGTINKANN